MQAGRDVAGLAGQEVARRSPEADRRLFGAGLHLEDGDQHHGLRRPRRPPPPRRARLPPPSSSPSGRRPAYGAPRRRPAGFGAGAGGGGSGPGDRSAECGLAASQRSAASSVHFADELRIVASAGTHGPLARCQSRRRPREEMSTRLARRPPQPRTAIPRPITRNGLCPRPRGSPSEQRGPNGCAIRLLAPRCCPAARWRCPGGAYDRPRHGGCPRWSGCRRLGAECVGAEYAPFEPSKGEAAWT